MKTILLLGQPKSGRHVLLQQLSPQAKKETHGLLTTWSTHTYSFVTIEQSLTTIPTAALPRIDTVAILIEPTTLINTDQKLKLITWITTELSTLKDQSQSIHCIISKADSLLGFREYFAHDTVEAREAAFGLQSFSDKTTLLNTINQSLLSMLHQEPLIEKRTRLQAFPLQLEKLINNAEDVISRSLSQTMWRFGGLFFISCKQKPLVIDIHTETHQEIRPVLNEKVYFVQGVFQRLKQASVEQHLRRKKRDKKRWLAIPLAVFLVTGLLGLWHISYRQSIHAMAHITNILAAIKKNPDTPSWLQQMNQLQTARSTLNTPLSHYGRYIGLPQTTELKHQLDDQYNRLLITKFLPACEGQLTSTLTENMTKNMSSLYQALRIYLMLVTGKHRNHTEIIHWFQTHWQPASQFNSIKPHLINLLTRSPENWPIDKNLVKQAQLVLQDLPIANIGYLHVESAFFGKTIHLATLLPQQPYFNLKDTRLPNFFSTTQFNYVFNSAIPKSVQALKQHGDWVVGINQSSLADETIDQVAASVREIYISNFSTTWQSLLEKLKLKKVDSIPALQILVADLTDKQSNLYGLLNFMVGNARLNTDTPSSPTTKALGHLLKTSKLPASLKNMALLLQSINKSHNPNQASLAIASTILSQSSQPNPITTLLNTRSKKHTVITSWYHSIANQAWGLLLNGSRQALDAQWQQTVMPLYQNSIKTGYPINPTSTSDISPTTFTAFFGPDGALDTFTQSLKPFINTQQHYWTWQSYLGKTLGPPQMLLDNLMRASLIQQMFYTNSHSKRPHVSFHLIPMQKSPHIQQATCYFDGQVVPFDKTTALNTTINWPGPKKIGASWVIKLKNGKHHQHFVAGPWAALRLIQSGSLTPSNNPQKYTLSFSVGAHKWQYLLIPSQKINPWLSQVMPAFKLPKTLLPTH